MCSAPILHVELLVKLVGEKDHSDWLFSLENLKNGTDKSKEGTHYRNVSLLSFEQWIILILTKG